VWSLSQSLLLWLPRLLLEPPQWPILQRMLMPMLMMAESSISADVLTTKKTTQMTMQQQSHWHPPASLKPNNLVEEIRR
jgi:hypothetical protein